MTMPPCILSPLHIEGAAREIREQLERLTPGRPPLPTVRLQLLDYQLLALHYVAARYNRPGARVLEIGTGHGGSGYVLSRAAPLAQIVSLTISPAEVAAATAFWRSHGCRNITSRLAASWDYIQLEDGPHELDLVFVDGDHNRIARDLPWFNRLRPGGLFLCHDYSPQDSTSPSQIVYDTLNRAALHLGRPFDVVLVDENKIGMAGFCRRPGETL